MWATAAPARAASIAASAISSGRTGTRSLARAVSPAPVTAHVMNTSGLTDRSSRGWSRVGDSDRRVKGRAGTPPGQPSSSSSVSSPVASPPPPGSPPPAVPEPSPPVPPVPPPAPAPVSPPAPVPPPMAGPEPPGVSLSSPPGARSVGPPPPSSSSSSRRSSVMGHAVPDGGVILTPGWGPRQPRAPHTGWHDRSNARLRRRRSFACRLCGTRRACRDDRRRSHRERGHRARWDRRVGERTGRRADADAARRRRQPAGAGRADRALLPVDRPGPRPRRAPRPHLRPVSGDRRVRHPARRPARPPRVVRRPRPHALLARDRARRVARERRLRAALPEARRAQFDAARSGLYVKADGGSPRRLPLPRPAVRDGATSVTRVDLRGTRVAAVAADVYAYAFMETTAGTGMWSARVATSEGDGDERAGAMALGTTATLWTLTASSHAGDPNAARISRLQGSCLTWQTLTNPAGPDEADGYPATALAADTRTLYLVVPGTGIVTHEFAPVRPDCA